VPCRQLLLGRRFVRNYVLAWHLLPCRQLILNSVHRRLLLPSQQLRAHQLHERQLLSCIVKRPNILHPTVLLLGEQQLADAHMSRRLVHDVCFQHQQLHLSTLPRRLLLSCWQPCRTAAVPCRQLLRRRRCKLDLMHGWKLLPSRKQRAACVSRGLLLRRIHKRA
jgi:hypothetical protein